VKEERKEKKRKEKKNPFLLFSIEERESECVSE
jgi:hypothetical protein